MEFNLQPVGMSARCACGGTTILGKQMCPRCKQQFDRFQEEAAEIRAIEARLASLELALADRRGNDDEAGHLAFLRGIEAGARFHLHALGLDADADLPGVTAALLKHYHTSQRKSALASTNNFWKRAS